jgi:hypothetical protein
VTRILPPRLTRSIISFLPGAAHLARAPAPPRRRVEVPTRYVVLDRLLPAHLRRRAAPLSPPVLTRVTTQVAARLPQQPHLFPALIRHRGVTDVGRGHG